MRRRLRRTPAARRASRRGGDLLFHAARALRRRDRLGRARGRDGDRHRPAGRVHATAISRTFAAVMPALGLASYRYMLARVSARSWASISASAPRAACWRARCGGEPDARSRPRSCSPTCAASPPRRPRATRARRHLARSASRGDRRTGRGAGRRGAQVPRRRAAGRIPRRGGTAQRQPAHRRLRRPSRPWPPPRRSTGRRASGRARARPRCRPPLRRGGLRQCRRRPPARLHRDRPDRQRGQPHGGTVRRTRAALAAVGAVRGTLRPGDERAWARFQLRGCEGEAEVFALRPHG